MKTKLFLSFLCCLLLGSPAIAENVEVMNPAGKPVPVYAPTPMAVRPSGSPQPITRAPGTPTPIPVAVSQVAGTPTPIPVAITRAGPSATPIPVAAQPAGSPYPIAAVTPIPAAEKQYTGVPSNYTVGTTDATVFTLAAGERGWIQNLDDAPLAVKLGASASTSSFSFIMPAGTAEDDGKGGAKEIKDYVGAVSVAAMTGSPRYIAWKEAP